MMKQGIIIENIWDTMVMEQCLYAGYDYDLRFFSLAAVLLRRFYLDISKEQQSEFGEMTLLMMKNLYMLLLMLYILVNYIRLKEMISLRKI